MAKRKKAIIKKPVDRTEEILSRLEAFEAKLPRLAEIINTVHLYEDGLLFYKRSLGALLTPEQKEHARIAQVSEDQYAMELIRLCQYKIAEINSLRRED